jgi:hypothetical protein
MQNRLKALWQDRVYVTLYFTIKDAPNKRSNEIRIFNESRKCLVQRYLKEIEQKRNTQ